MIPLTKTLQLTDMDEPEFLDQLVLVDKHWDLSQHPMRCWEYGMVLLALDTVFGPATGVRVADVGGFGSPFTKMAADRYKECYVIDPKRTEGAGAIPVEEWAAHYKEDEQFDAVVSISTFEHTTQPLLFLASCIALLKPGGLLFLTFDYNGEPAAVDDVYHFHWMRERIVTHAMWDALMGACCLVQDMELVGEVDTRDHGPTVYDYTFASLCLRKAP